MNIKTLSLIAAVLLQPVLAASTMNSATAAATGGGGGGGGAAGGGDNGGAGNLQSVMDSGICGSWDFRKTEKAMEAQKPLCSANQSAAPSVFTIIFR